MTAIKARIAMTIKKGGKIISYQWRQTGWISDIAHTKSSSRKKTVCLPRPVLDAIVEEWLVPCLVEQFLCDRGITRQSL